MKETLTEKILNNLQYIDLQITIHKGEVLKPEINNKILDLIQESKKLLNKNQELNENKEKN